MPIRNKLAVVFCCLLAGSCAPTPSRQTAADEGPKPQWHVMLLPTCPSETKATRGVPALFRALIVSGVGKLMDRVLGGVADIVKKDADGISSTVVSPGYLWWQDAQQGSSGVASCAVVTYSSSSPAQWCAAQGGPFASNPSICEFFDQLQTWPQAEQLVAGYWRGSAAPRFYAEIKLSIASEQHGVVPISVIYYYPKAIHDSRKFAGDKPRTLSMTVSTAKMPGGEAATGSIVATLKDIRPSPYLQKTTDIAPASGWVPVLAKPETQTHSAAANPVGMLEVNVRAEVHEVGDPNRFLQWLGEFLKFAEAAMKEYVKNQVEQWTGE